MMQLHTYHERKNTKSLKWDQTREIFTADDILPMWVADMDFQAPHEVNEALIERAKHGIYGYTIIDDPVKEAICQWLNRRQQWTIEKEWLSFFSGVIPALQIALQAFTEVHDKILIQTPVYTPFYNIIKNKERKIVKNPLLYKDGKYEIDFIHFEKQLQNNVKAFILCSPHNPVGRVWTNEELNKIVNLCRQYEVMILSDEIHCDLISPDNQHRPIASLSKEAAEITVTFMAPSKTFNLAGLQAAYTITADKKLRTKINQQIQKEGMTYLNTMGITAMEAAYAYGENWLDALLQVLEDNKKYVQNMFEKHAPALKVVPSEGTYLLWIDCKELGMDHQALGKFMVEKAKVGLNKGIDYGKEGAQFMRMNIACPRTTLEEGVRRIIQAIHQR